MLEERNNGLVEQLQNAKEEARNADNRRDTMERELRQVQMQHAQLTQKLANTEAQLDLMQKVCLVSHLHRLQSC